MIWSLVRSSNRNLNKSAVIRTPHEISVEANAFLYTVHTLHLFGVFLLCSFREKKIYKIISVEIEPSFCSVRNSDNFCFCPFSYSFFFQSVNTDWRIYKTIFSLNFSEIKTEKAEFLFFSSKTKFVRFSSSYCFS